MIKNTKRKTIALLLITFIIIYFVLKDDFSDIISIVFKSNILIIFLCVTLTLSYYTSTKENSDRIKRNTNLLIRGQNEFT